MDHVNPNINFQLISDVLRYYRKNNYIQIDTPWMVEEKYIKYTYNGDKFNELQSDLHLVGSAEQGFIKLMVEDELYLDREYVSCTPCFRKETNINAFHQYCFMKIELFKWCSTYNEALKTINKFLTDATELYSMYIDKRNIKQVYVKKDSFDIIVNDIELGSYSISRYEDKLWVCGTGLALPRFSYVMGQVNE